MKTKILYIGRDTKMASILHRLLNARPDWEGFTALTNANAFELAGTEQPDIVLLGSGISDEEERALRNFFHAYPAVKVIQHYGGGSGLLYNEISEALAGSGS